MPSLQRETSGEDDELPFPNKRAAQVAIGPVPPAEAVMKKGVEGAERGTKRDDGPSQPIFATRVVVPARTFLDQPTPGTLGPATQWL